MVNEDINFNEIKLSGKINNIIEKENYTFFGLTCETYSTNNSKAFVSLRIYKDLYNQFKDLFIKGNKVFIKGYLNTYSDNSNNINTYVMTTKIAGNSKDIDSVVPHFRYDPDGVMVWDGKRCESEKCSEEELKELEEFLSEYR